MLRDQTINPIGLRWMIRRTFNYLDPDLLEKKHTKFDILTKYVCNDTNYKKK